MALSETNLSNQFRIYDTLKGAIRLLEPIDKDKIKLYVCGPTVYDDAHLGHARCYITWDVLYRHLLLLGYKVQYVRNITDVDDKIILKAKQEKTTAEAIATRFNNRFQEDMNALNVLAPTLQPKATEHIKTMHQAIGDLIAKHIAYVTASGTVYFRTTACNDYGKLSKKPLDDLKSGARVDIDPEKESPLDFALWKAAKKDETVFWDSPWGKGRPGWHIECSAMNYAELGTQIDIHAGGADLIFPHHENEIAQSECWTGAKPFAKYWMHNGFVNVSGEKMSKSLGNFATVRTILEHYDANVIRYFLLQHHYRMPVDFNDDALVGAENRIAKIYRTFQNALQVLNISNDTFQTANHKNKSVSEEYLSAMADDLNTPKALAVFNTNFNKLDLTSTTLQEDFESLIAIWDALGFSRIIGSNKMTLPSTLRDIILKYGVNLESDENLEQCLNSVVSIRSDAKRNKDWALSDKIRDDLKAIGVMLKDSKDGTTTYEVIAIESVVS